MFIQRILLVCLIFGSTVIASCIGGCPDVLEYVKIENMEINNLKPLGEQTWTGVQAGESVKWNEFLMECQLNGTFHAQDMQKTNGNGLYAVSCAHDGDFGSKDGITSMYVITKSDYNQRFKANDTLNSIVRANISKSGRQFEESLAEFVENRKDVIQETIFFLRLDEAPERQDFQQFKIVIELENGDIIKAQTNEISLKN